MTGRHASRSKNGCNTCRRRKVKCGEERPVCARCISLRLSCEWGATVKRGRLKAPVRYLQPARQRRPPSSAATVTTSDVDLLELFAGYPPISRPDNIPFAPQLAPNLSSASPEVLLPAGWPLSNTLCRSLSEAGFACSNSLVLSERDRKYFEYFPSSSIVFYYIKAWPWNGFSYLYQGPAASNKIVMRMILAMSANDMHRNGLMVESHGRPTAEGHARYHYGRAVKEFRQLLETPPRPFSPAELETIFAIMFLMVCYEWQFGESVHYLHLHLRGVRSLLESHPELFGNKNVDEVLVSMDSGSADISAPTVSFIPEQLLLWVLYIDASCRTMGVTDSVYDYVLQSANPVLHPDRLYRCARLWGRCFWGSEYPDQEVSDDIENYRGLELLHRGTTLLHKMWQALTDDPVQTQNNAEVLLSQMMALREQFSDLFLTAKFARTGSTRRTLITINVAVTTFYAQVLFHRRLLYPPGLPSTFHRLAVTNIIEIAKNQYSSDPRLMRRLHWPLLMALIETTDPSRRKWLRERLADLRPFHSEYRWANEIADKVLSEQDATKGIFADIKSLIRRHACG